MIEPKDFVDCLKACDINFVTGVPDSILKDACASIGKAFAPTQHIIAANEGCAVGLAIGNYLATGKPALVYMQNSGLGNAINPLASLADPMVFAIPMVLMIGWRAEVDLQGEQKADEPQHRKQGQISEPQLRLLDIPCTVIDAQSDYQTAVADMTAIAIQQSRPSALLVRSGTFAGCSGGEGDTSGPALSREHAIEVIIDSLDRRAAVVSTTGKASRELFELRRARGEGHGQDLLTVGGMGHASQAAAGFALARPDREVICIDGDGAALMHLGGLSNSADCPNLTHILLNNAAHESVGGQPTKGARLDFSAVARALGYGTCERVDTAEDLERVLRRFHSLRGSRFIEVRCALGSRPDLGRPDQTPAKNKQDFMQHMDG
ncbi:MAG: phosphonopyruvate decarboxylase [Pseudomonadota bacterium]